MKIALSKPDTKLEKCTGWLDYFKVDYDVLDYNNFREDLDRFDDYGGLILSGGVDIYPEIYCDWDTVETKGSYLPDRDGFELQLLEKAIRNNIPVLGLCRGNQLMNVYFRGSLIFDLEQIRNVNHRKISPDEDRIHEAYVIRDTLLYEMVKSDKITVNSSHHQSVDRLGEGLMISAKSDDGIVEAIEYSDKHGKPFFSGVQWHPERIKDRYSIASKNILDKFISECK